MTRSPWSRVAGGIFAAGTAVILLTVGLFLLAGRWDWTRGWLYLALLATGETSRTLCIWRLNPGLLERRGEIGPGTKPWDIVLLGLFGLAYLASLVVAAVDARNEWSAVSPWLSGVGALLYASNVLVVTAAMTVNPHFEKTVRIQDDRGHRVVDTGPYRIVRHPGYAATIVGFVGSAPLLLGSWWAFIPAGVAAVVLVIRTAAEDRTLRRELAGYAEYAGQVRFRLVPRLW